jgi:hypothetical protein
MPHVWMPYRSQNLQICGICESITQKEGFESPDVLVKMPVEMLFKTKRDMSKSYKLYTCEEIVALRTMME